MATSSFNNPFFAAIYNRLARSKGFRSMTDPYRKRLAQLAQGSVLEIGAGGGQNFSFYDPSITTQVVAIEPNAHMRRMAEEAARQARLPIQVQDTPAEALPFSENSFDAILGTLVLCSVRDPAQSLAEMARVLKPGGRLLLFEHVRNTHSSLMARLQTALTPAQRLFAGNCHLNRDTPAAVRAASFVLTTEERYGGGIQPLTLLVATKPEH